MSRELRAYLDGTWVGTLTQSQRGALGFAYDDGYERSPDPTPLSLSMPLGRSRHSPRVVGAWLEGLLPDNQQVRELWGRQFGVSANNPFVLLSHVGRDAAGAVQILPPGQDSDDAAKRRGDVEWLGDGEVVDILRELALRRADWGTGRRAGRWSLAGAQAKVALYRDPTTGRWGVPRDSTPTTHILKPALYGLADHHLNEVLCLRAARLLGIPAVDVDVLEAADVQAMVSVRYARAPGAGGAVRRLHQEDLCQALAIHPSRKYQSEGGPGVGEVADLFGRLDLRDREASRRRFFDALALNVLIAGTDAHAKNYSVLLAGGRAQMAPLYDVASTAPYDVDTPAASAMKIGDHWVLRQVAQADWVKVGRRLGLDADAAVSRVRELRDALPAAFDASVATLPESLRARARSIADAVEQFTVGLAAHWGSPA